MCAVYDVCALCRQEGRWARSQSASAKRVERVEQVRGVAGRRIEDVLRVLLRFLTKKERKV